MEDTKTATYYTPELEEFHIGFEHEYQASKGEWLKSIFPEQFQTGAKGVEGWAEFTPDMLIGEGRAIRVKYLDKEDIESLGFKWQKYIPAPTELLCNSEEKQVFIKANTRLILFTNRIAIECFPIGGKMYKTVFEGICKNKSKLKSLLKDIVIL